jgi:hypothetical protein
VRESRPSARAGTRRLAIRRASIPESFQVGCHDGLALAGEVALDGLFELFGREGEEAGGRAHEDHVGRARVARFLRYAVGLEDDGAGEGLEGGEDLVEVRIVRDVLHGLGRGDDGGVGREPGKVAEGLEGLEGEEELGRAFGDGGARDGLVREAEVGEDLAAALGHAVDLGLLDVEAGFHGGLRDDDGDGDAALAADAAEDYVVLHAFLAFLRASRQPRAEITTEGPS